MGKPVLPEGEYDAFLRDKPEPKLDRVQLYDYETEQHGWEAIQIHTGTKPEHSAGCYLVGTGHGASDSLTGDRNAMTRILSIINNSGNGQILVRIHDHLRGM